MNDYQVWDCKIVVPANIKLPEDFDGFPRRAALIEIAKKGIPVIACFSGWGGDIKKLTESEINFVQESVKRQEKTE